MEAKNQVIIFNPKKNYIDQNYIYGEALSNASNANWAITGVIRAVSRNINLRYIHLVPNYSTRNITEENLIEYILIGLTNDGNSILLQADKESDTIISLLTPTNEVFGTVTLQDEENISFKIN